MLKGSTLPVAIVQAPPRDRVVEFVCHLQRDGDSCGAADKSIIMNIAIVNPAVTETSPRDPFSSSNCAFDNKREKSVPSKRESNSKVACVEEDVVRLARSHSVLRQTDLFWADTFVAVELLP